MRNTEEEQEVVEGLCEAPRARGDVLCCGSFPSACQAPVSERRGEVQAALHQVGRTGKV